MASVVQLIPAMGFSKYLPEPTGHVVDISKWAEHINGLVQDCSNSIANALELPQSRTKPSAWCLSL